MRKYLGLILLAVIPLMVSSSNPIALLAQESSDEEVETEQSDNDDLGRRREETQKQIEELEAKISETQTTSRSLNQQIAYMDNQVRLTQLRIAQSENEIKVLLSEIDNLGTKIESLDMNLDEMAVLLASRVQQTYKVSTIDSLSVFFGSESFSDLASKVKVMQRVQLNDRQLLLAMQKTKTNFEQQKTLKEEKQAEVQTLRGQLERQQETLRQEQQAKQQLLTETRNSEAVYQSLLSQARAQLAALSRFVASQGGASILQNQTKCDDWGCYYSQRDALWGNIGMGGSEYSVAEYGCLISSVSMIASHYGKDIKPVDIAVVSSAFQVKTGYLRHSFSVKGVDVQLSAVSKNLLDSELAAGRPVIAGLYSGPDHFIVIVKKEGSEYIMHDPFMENGSYRPLTDKYPVSAITSLRLVKFN